MTLSRRMVVHLGLLRMPRRNDGDQTDTFGSVSGTVGGAQPLSLLIAEVLAERFEESELTQAQVGVAAGGLTQSQVSKFLRGARVPHLDTLDAICAALGTDVATVAAEAEARR